MTLLMTVLDSMTGDTYDMDDEGNVSLFTTVWSRN